MGLSSYRPNNGSIWVRELERFCQQIRGNGGDDHTQVFVRSADGIIFNINGLRINHSKGPVLEIDESGLSQIEGSPADPFVCRESGTRVHVMGAESTCQYCHRPLALAAIGDPE